jgi:site-specific DNA recombinase
VLVSIELSVVGYIRCSTQEQTDSGLSLDGQRARIEAWCEASGSRLHSLIEDRGVSGSKRLRDRPGGQIIAELLGARAPSADAVVVLRLDRLGRDAAETLHLMKQFSGGKVGLVSITERIDLTTPQGRAMAGVAAVFAELERGLIGDRTSEALKQLRSRGRVYGPVPYGFDAVDGLLVRNRAEQATLSRMRDLRDTGFSFAVIADRLNARGIPSKRGGIWHAMSVRSVLLTDRRDPIKPSTPEALASQPL